jgi:hypothetical protein
MIANINMAFRFLDPFVNARRVCWWYRKLFRYRPIIRIELAERQLNDPTPFAKITAAARGLSSLGYSVVIDGSENSVEPGALATHREQVIQVEPFLEEEIEKLPQLQEVMEVLQAHKLKEVAFQVFGGVPADYVKLIGTLQQQVDLKDLEDARNKIKALEEDKLNNLKALEDATKSIVEEAISRALADAVMQVAQLRIKFPEFNDVLNQLKEADHVVVSKAKVSSEPSPNKVLHLVRDINQGWVYVPLNAATRLVLRHGWTDMPSIAAVRVAIAKPQTGPGSEASQAVPETPQTPCAR